MAAIIDGVICAGDVAEDQGVGFGDESDGPVGIVADEDTDGHVLSMGGSLCCTRIGYRNSHVAGRGRSYRSGVKRMGFSGGTLEGPFSLVIALESPYTTRNPQPAHAASWRSLAELGGEAQGTGSSRGPRNGGHVGMSWVVGVLCQL